jgi:hypothetical protein
MRNHGLTERFLWVMVMLQALYSDFHRLRITLVSPHFHHEGMAIKKLSDG